jgi:hypothetical protein
MANTHYYSLSEGRVIKRPNQNPQIEAGRDAGRKQRKKDEKANIYPREGLPISREGRDLDWIEGYRRGYYQTLKQGRPELLEAKRVQISVTADRALLEAADKARISRSDAIDIGLQTLLAAVQKGSKS